MAATLLASFMAVGSAALGQSQSTASNDCSLNGDFIGGTCVCDRQWTGPDCERLNLRPAAADAGLQAFGKFASWGGSVMQDQKTGTWCVV